MGDGGGLVLFLDLEVVLEVGTLSLVRSLNLATGVNRVMHISKLTTNTYLSALWWPSGMAIFCCGVVGQPSLAGVVGVHNVNFPVIVTVGVECPLHTHPSAPLQTSHHQPITPLRQAASLEELGVSPYGPVVR